AELTACKEEELYSAFLNSANRLFRFFAVFVAFQNFANFHSHYSFAATTGAENAFPTPAKHHKLPYLFASAACTAATKNEILSELFIPCS
ncbi:hypothetical protein LZB41_09620, partial [Campylobacter jejuni]|nr:hypothetical protein [Campylobacter jejuni]